MANGIQNSRQVLNIFHNFYLHPILKIMVWKYKVQHQQNNSHTPLDMKKIKLFLGKNSYQSMAGYEA